MSEKDRNIISFDDLLWTQTRYSDVLKLDRRVVAQALAEIPAREKGGKQAWHVRDAMPAIYRRVFGIAAPQCPDPAKLHPKVRLDHYRAERERLKLELEQKTLLAAVEVEAAIAKVFKAIAQQLDVLPAALERDFALPPDQVTRLYDAMDAAREALYQTTLAAITDA